MLRVLFVGLPFLHRSCVPLDKVDFRERKPGDHGFAAECAGVCGA